MLAFRGDDEPSRDPCVIGLYEGMVMPARLRRYASSESQIAKGGGHYGAYPRYSYFLRSSRTRHVMMAS